MTKTFAFAAVFVGGLVLGAVVFSPATWDAEAHTVGITRLDIQNAVTSALQRQPQRADAVTKTELTMTLQQVLARCRFQGQFSKGKTDADDPIDFQGTIRC